jgi:hypothetical protein
MNWKVIILAIFFHGHICPFSFSDFFAKEQIQDPSFEEHKQDIRNRILLGSALCGSSAAFFANRLFLENQFPSIMSIPLAVAYTGIGITGIVSIYHAVSFYRQTSTPEKFSAVITQGKKNFTQAEYANVLKQFIKQSKTRKAMLLDKQLYLSLAATLCGLFISYSSEVDEKNNPSLILTTAGICMLVHLTTKV